MAVLVVQVATVRVTIGIAVVRMAVMAPEALITYLCSFARDRKD